MLKQGDAVCPRRQEVVSALTPAGMGEDGTNLHTEEGIKIF